MKLRQIGSNQTEIVLNGNTILFSYQTPVAAFCNGDGFYKTSQYYSVTTSRHINAWLRDNDQDPAKTQTISPEMLACIAGEELPKGAN